jgi:ABC-2 type transport system permease protein
MEQELGRDKMRRFLKYELDRYLAGRGRELVEEMPLLFVEDQPYIHYSKGSVVTYALRDYLGEETVNRVLARYLEQVKFQQPPYTTSLELLSALRDGAGPGRERLLEDLLATITLFSNRAERATATRLADGRYRVDLTVAAKKLRADGQGVESEVPVDDWVDVGVFGERKVDGRSEETVLLLEKRRITGPTATFQLTVDALPVRAGIDPYNKLVDRDSDDNVRRVELVSATDAQAPGAPGAAAG